MDKSYRLGIVIVLTTVFVSAVLCLALATTRGASPGRAAEDLEDAALELGEFRLTEARAARLPTPILRVESGLPRSSSPTVRSPALASRA